MVYIYILRLTNSKFYVGKSNSLVIRIKSHINKQGAAWTRKYPYVKIDRIIPGCSTYDEDKYTIKYMEKYGIDNVRGGLYSQIVLPKKYVTHIQRIINHARDKCIICGDPTHFAAECPNKVLPCHRCGRNDHTLNSCQHSFDIYKYNINAKIFCFRCGRMGHTSPTCQYQFDNYGNELNIS